MSTRANILIQDETECLYFYRHSDGYPSATGQDLRSFVEDYRSGALRLNVPQSAGWLVVRGHFEYADPPSRRPNPSDRFTGWKVGAYEPTTGLHGDVEYIYVIDLKKRELTCRKPKTGFWDDPTIKNTVACPEFKKVGFGEACDALGLHEDQTDA